MQLGDIKDSYSDALYVLNFHRNDDALVHHSDCAYVHPDVGHPIVNAPMLNHLKRLHPHWRICTDCARRMQPRRRR